jgi:hypothetical protein
MSFSTALHHTPVILGCQLIAMRAFKALRRSIKGEKEKPHINIAPKSAVAIVPPKKVCIPSYDCFLQARNLQAILPSRHYC